MRTASDASKVLVQVETGAIVDIASTVESETALEEGCRSTVLVDVAVTVLGQVGVVLLPV